MSDVLVVGAGIAGAAVAHELRRLGAAVTVVDRGRVGGASSGLNAGGVRTQFSLVPNIRAAAATVRRLGDLPEELGEEIAFRRAGYLLLFNQPGDRELLERAVARQNQHDLPSSMISPDEVRELVPGVFADDLAGAAFSPTDGYLDPRATTTAYGRAVRRGGGRLVEDCRIVRFEIAGQRVSAAISERDDRFPCGMVVNAAGAWAPALARLYGGALPIEARRSHAYYWDRALDGGRLTPNTLDLEQGIYFHSEGRGVLSGLRAVAPVPDPPWSVGVDPGLLDGMRAQLVHRLPELEGARAVHSWAGLIEVTPDENPIVGWTHLDNVYTFAGFSGHGMCLAPGLAVEVAREVTGSPPTLPMDLYRLERFARGEGRREVLWETAPP